MLETWFKVPYQSIATRRETNQTNRALHKHDFIELVIIFDGHGTHLISGINHAIHTGDIFVIPPNIDHAYTDTKNLSLINILIRNHHLQTLERECGNMPGFYALFKLEPRIRTMSQFKSQLQLSSKVLAEISEWIAALEQEAKKITPLACSRARAFLQLILGDLCMQYEALVSLDSTKLLRIANCVQYMDRHLGDPLNLADLARQARMSERSLSRNFHTTIGQSPIEYLLNMRIERAADLLLTSPATIAQIAYEVGFGDANYFTRQFRKLKNLSPREFRKKHRST